MCSGTIGTPESSRVALGCEVVITTVYGSVASTLVTFSTPLPYWPFSVESGCEHPVEGVDDIGRGQRPAVRPLDAVAQVERPGLAVGGGFPLLGQRGDDRHVLRAGIGQVVIHHLVGIERRGEDADVRVQRVDVLLSGRSRRCSWSGRSVRRRTGRARRRGASATAGLASRAQATAAAIPAAMTRPQSALAATGSTHRILRWMDGYGRLGCLACRTTNAVPPTVPTIGPKTGVARIDVWSTSMRGCVGTGRQRSVRTCAPSARTTTGRRSTWKPSATTLFDEVEHRLLPTDDSVRWRHGDLFYYMRSVTGSEYEQFMSTRDPAKPGTGPAGRSDAGHRTGRIRRNRGARAQPRQPAARLLVRHGR